MDIWHNGAKLEDHKKEHDVSHPHKYREFSLDEHRFFQ